MSDIELCVGDTKKLRWAFTDETSGEPVIITGHTFELNLESSTGDQTPVTGELAEGDNGVYFAIPSSVNSVGGEYKYRLVDTDPSGEVKTVEKGIIQYE